MLRHLLLRHQVGLQLEPQHFGPVSIEPFVDYSQLGMPPSMDSPNFTDYSQVSRRRWTVPTSPTTRR